MKEINFALYFFTYIHIIILSYHIHISTNPPDSIARLDEFERGGSTANSVALIFRSWVWARYCSMKLWALFTKYETDPSSGLEITSSQKIKHITFNFDVKFRNSGTFTLRQ